MIKVLFFEFKAMNLGGIIYRYEISLYFLMFGRDRFNLDILICCHLKAGTWKLG